MKDEDLKKTIASNIALYRNSSGMTQLQLAEKLNYSDKSVSKWENADGVPDVFVLQRMAELFGVEISDLMTADTRSKKRHSKKIKLHGYVMALSALLVIFVAATVFGFGFFFTRNDKFALAFAYAVPVAAITTLVLTSIWKHRILGGISVSIIIWGFIAAVIITLVACGLKDWDLWVFIVIGVPLEALAILWYFFRDLVYKAKAVIVDIASNKSKQQKHNKNAPTEKNESNNNNDEA